MRHRQVFFLVFLSSAYQLISVHFYRYVYAGGRDGYLEVFSHGEYGNILERIETGFGMVLTSFILFSLSNLGGQTSDMLSLRRLT